MSTQVKCVLKYSLQSFSYLKICILLKNLALVFETVLGIFLAYTPGMDLVLMTMPVKPIWLLPALPFALLIMVTIRRNYSGL